MVVGKASIHNIMEGMESTGGVRLHNHKRKLKHRFDIIKKLGQGTYGKVQLGINKETGQEVAIKTIKKCKIETDADLIRIRREVQIMSSVQHPNIIHIYEVFENREKMVLVMEYAAGGELYDYLSDRKVLTEQEARRIFRQIAIAVYYCHKHKICHRDLKLENILLDQVGNAKIADFGLSNVFDEQRLMNTFCGSPLYASPEIVKGTPYHGPEVDCWSLGVLLYTLVYGAMPFDGSNFKRLVKQISQSDYFEPKNPSPASPLIKDMLTVCPTRRADIEKICTHWWVNEGYSVNCLDIAEDLAAETPVRLDLPLFLVPRSTSAEKLIVADQQPTPDIGSNIPTEALVPTRCHSVGSLMELDQTSTDRRIRELIEEEAGTAGAAIAAEANANANAKRKLEPDLGTSSNSQNSKEWGARRKSKMDEREPKAYKSASRHHSAPIPNTLNFILGEIMEVEPATVPTCKTADIHNIEDTAACLELIEECAERSPSKERSKTPLSPQSEQLPKDISMQDVQESIVKQSQQEIPEKYLPEESKTIEPSIPVKSDVQSVHSDKEVNNISKAAVASIEADLSDIKQIQHQISASEECVNVDTTHREFKKLKEKALSLDSDLTTEVKDLPPKTVERRRSKIFETAEKFNQIASGVENDKPKKIFIPGVNVCGAKRVFERKASLSSITPPQPIKTTTSKIIIDVPTEKKSDKSTADKPKQQESLEPDEQVKKEEAKRRRAVDIISGAIGKPPVVKKTNGSPPISPLAQDVKKLPLKIPIGPNEIRSATVSVSTPVDTKYQFEEAMGGKQVEESSTSSAQVEEPKMSSKMEITLKSATLPRPRKTSKAEISLSGVKSEPVAFKSQVEAKIDAFQPQKLRTQRSEIAFPVAASVSQTPRSSSLEPESKSTIIQPRERIIPIQVEGSREIPQHSSTPPPQPPKPPVPQRSLSQRSGSLSRQSTADSDTDSALGSTVGPEPIRKSPREYIIPIAVEGGGYVTPRSGSVEPDSKASTPTSANPRSSRLSRPRVYDRRILSDASEDESPFSSLHRDSEDLLHRHMHRLRSSRPSRQPSEHADSLSSGEDDDDDGFELLTAENLFSRLLSRVRSLTQRLNVDDTRNTDFPSSRLFARSPQAFWGLNKPLSRRLTESQFKHSLSRDDDIFSRKDPTNSPNLPTANSSTSREDTTPTRESLFEFGSNTLPRDKIDIKDVEAEATQVRKETQETLEQNFTPSLARRLSRQLLEQTRRSLTRSSSVPYDKYNPDSLPDNAEDLYLLIGSDSSSHESPYESSFKQSIGPPGTHRTGSTSSLTESTSRQDRLQRRSPRRSISLFESSDELDDYDPDSRVLPPVPKQVMTLGRRYKHGTSERNRSSSLRRDSLLGYRTADKIQEEPGEQGNNWLPSRESTNEKSPSISLCNSASNIGDTTSSVSVKSCETSPNDSTTNINDYKSTYKSDESKNFENRLLAAENLIKESKLKNLGPSTFNRNLYSSYTDSEKCEKDSLDSISSATKSTAISKRRSCIPSLRLRSGSLTREAGSSVDRRRSFSTCRDVLGNREQRATSSPPSPPSGPTLLRKFFRSTSQSSRPSTQDTATESTESDNQNQPAKPKQHRISRFLRPDFFDTPREESQYVKEKEAQKAAENERRKSRFMKRKTENKAQQESAEKDTKNEMNTLTKDQTLEVPENLEEKEESKIQVPIVKPKVERQGSRNSFLHSLEMKLERLRSNDDSSKTLANGVEKVARKEEGTRENSAPPIDTCTEGKDESYKLKKTLSVEDLRVAETQTIQTSAKSKVSSVLGLFKSSEGKSSGNILSKLKKTPPKYTASKSDTVTTLEETTRIPSKSSKSDSKIDRNKKVSDPIKKVIDQPNIDRKRSPPKEKPKERRTSAPLSRDSKKSPEKSGPSTASESTSTSNIESDAPRIRPLGKSGSPPSKVESTEKKNEITINLEEKKFAKTKKNTSLKVSSSNSDGISAKKDDEKKAKKILKPKELAEKSEESTKKKKIVRVVKKVVKKSSDSTSDSKSEEKSNAPPKPSPSRAISLKSEKTCSDSSATSTLGKTAVKNNKPKESNETDSRTSGSCSSSIASTSTTTDSTSRTREISTTDNTCSNLPPTEEEIDLDLGEKGKQATARSNLKLDLSKIPQHTFRNGGGIKKDSPKSNDSIKTNLESKTIKPSTSENSGDNLSDKLLECLSRMTHRASITGNKILIDKPLRAKDVAQLKMEVAECARIIESGITDPIESINPETSLPIPNRIEETKPATPVKIDLEKSRPSEEKDSREDTKSLLECPSTVSEPRDHLLSPTDEIESFDSWSLSSLDFNQSRSELHSPTSPTSHSSHLAGSSSGPFPRNENSAESVIDRIRRRSFYSRFNDRRKPSLTASPPGPSTLPRKYPASKLSRSYSSSRRHTEPENILDEETRRSRKKSIELLPSSSYHPTHLKLSSTDYPILPSSYDPPRRHHRSPTLDFSLPLSLSLTLSRPRYQTTDPSPETELPPTTTATTTTVPYRPGSASGCRSSNNSSGMPSYATLPRKYGSTAEPKSVEYYEELLAPANPEYLLARKSPVTGEYAGRCENGYHNGNLDQHLATRRKSYGTLAKVVTGETVGNADGQPNDGKRGNEEEQPGSGERKALPSGSLDSRSLSELPQMETD